MTTVTGLTAERMLEIEAASVVDGEVIAGNLILTKHDGGQINAGNVVGPAGPQGPIGSDLSVISAVPVSDVGIINQIRAGRSLTLADFTNLGLSAPIGLWNLANALTDGSGNGRTLTNKGTVTFAGGINGAASTAALFTGSTAQALYIVDTGASDPFRIKVGSIGAWFRTAKQGIIQAIISKRGAAGAYGYWLRINASNTIGFGASLNGTAYNEAIGQTNICDDRWHFVVATFDGNLQKLYVDGVLEGLFLDNFTMFGTASPLNIGAFGADGSVVAGESHFGRVSNAFITSDILTEDQARNLYCAKIPHALGAIPSRVTLNIRRRRKGAALVTGDFPASPGRMYNFSAGSLGNGGAAGAAGDLANTGTVLNVAGVDGSRDNALHFAGALRLNSTDADLPAGTTSVSYGCWMKTSNDGAGTFYLITWGTTNGTNDTRLNMAAGVLACGSGANAVNGPYIADGQWHFVVVVHDNAAIDGIKRKLYVDGRLVAGSTVLNSVTLGGANKFAIGANLANSNFFLGEIDTVFVTSSVLTFEDIFKLYVKATQALAASPKNVGDHIEALTATDLLAIFDTLDSAHQVDLKVAA